MRNDYDPPPIQRPIERAIPQDVVSEIHMIWFVFEVSLENGFDTPAPTLEQMRVSRAAARLGEL